MIARILHRYNEANYWAELNPVLGEGEIGIESNTGLCKIGDGITEWSGLDYTTGEGQRYFYQSMVNIPLVSPFQAHRGQIAFGYVGAPGNRRDRTFMYLNKTAEGETACELTPISFFFKNKPMEAEE